MISCPGGLNAYRLVRGLEAYRLTLIYADASCYCNALLSSKIEEVSQDCFVFDVVNFENEDISQNSFVFDAVKFKH